MYDHRGDNNNSNNNSNSNKTGPGNNNNSHGYFVPPPNPQDNYRSNNNPYRPSATSGFSHYDHSHISATQQNGPPPQSPSSAVNVGNGFLHSSSYAPQEDQHQQHHHYNQPRPPPRPSANFQYSSHPYPSDTGSPTHPPANFYNPMSHTAHNPSISPHTSPTLPEPPIPTAPSNLPQLTGAGTRQPGHEFQSSFYNNPSMGYQNQSAFQYAQHQSAQYPQNQNQSHHQQAPRQQPMSSQQQQQQQHQQPHQQQQQSMQSAVPFMVAGLQQMSTAATGTGGMNHAAIGAQLLRSFAPGAAGLTNQMIDQGQETVMSFMRMPKYYFAVNHRYVLKKLSLILMPFLSRAWSRQRGLGQGNFDGASDGSTCYLPPRDDVNAPDLYIPVMAFLSYVLVVGFVFGTRNAFQAEVLAKYFSKGLGVLTMEVLIIKLGLYLINARPTPWLDVIAYRGYKFVGVVLTIVLGLVAPKLYVPALLYSATAMGIFLMRSHRKIILPRDMDQHERQDLARRNAFLLFVCVFQYPIYWILARVFSVKT